jgi:hypothetical protein
MVAIFTGRAGPPKHIEVNKTQHNTTNHSNTAEDLPNARVMREKMFEN